MGRRDATLLSVLIHYVLFASSSAFLDQVPFPMLKARSSSGTTRLATVHAKNAAHTPSISEALAGVVVAVQATAYDAIETVAHAADEATMPARELWSSLDHAIRTGTEAYHETRKKTTVVDVTAASTPVKLVTAEQQRKAAILSATKYTIRPSASKTLSPEARREKELLLRGPHSPLYKQHEFGI